MPCEARQEVTGQILRVWGFQPPPSSPPEIEVMCHVHERVRAFQSRLGRRDLSVCTLLCVLHLECAICGVGAPYLMSDPFLVASGSLLVSPQVVLCIL